MNGLTEQNAWKTSHWPHNLSWKAELIIISLLASLVVDCHAFAQVPQGYQVLNDLAEPVESVENPLSPVTLTEFETTVSTPVLDLQRPLVSQSSHTTNPVTKNASPAIRKINTSRPSVTDTTSTVPKGSLQYESGATYINNRNNTRQWLLPEVLLRFGVLKNTEFRIVAPNYVNTSVVSPSPPDVSGADTLGDMSVGFSHHHQFANKVDFAIIPVLNIPTGAAPNTSKGMDPEMRLVVSRGVGRFTFSSQLDTRWNTNKSAPAAVQFTPTFVTYYDFTKKLSGFAEWAATVPTTGYSNQIVQGGLLYTPTLRQQLDVRVGTGLNAHSPNILVGFGYSFRVDGLLP